MVNHPGGEREAGQYSSTQNEWGIVATRSLERGDMEGEWCNRQDSPEEFSFLPNGNTEGSHDPGEVSLWTTVCQANELTDPQRHPVSRGVRRRLSAREVPLASMGIPSSFGLYRNPHQVSEVISLWPDRTM